MKGLIFREFYLARKYYILSFMVFLIISLLGILTRLSMIFGNLSSMSPETFADLDKQTLPVFTYLPAVILMISVCTDGGVTYSDYLSKWLTYCQCSPLKEIKTVTVKFICKTILLFSAIVLSTINAVIVKGITGNSFGTKTFLNLSLIATLGIIFSSLIIPMSYKYKTKNAVTVRLVGIFAVVSVPIGFLTYHKITKYAAIDAGGNGTENLIEEIIIKRYEEILSRFSFLMPIIIITALTISFICSVNILRRRDN